MLAVVFMTGCTSKSFIIEVNQDIEIAYGEELDHTKLFNGANSNEDVYVKEVTGFDSKQVGEQVVSVTFTDDKQTQEETVTVNVNHTKPPEIILEKDIIDITLDSLLELDIEGNIKSVTDSAGGNIKINMGAIRINTEATKQYNLLDENEIDEDTTIANNAIKKFRIEDANDKNKKNLFLKNCYYIEYGDLNLKAVGDYTIRVIAVDSSGNKTLKDFQINIKEDVK